MSMIYGAAAASEFGMLGGGQIVLHLVDDEETERAAGSGHLRAMKMIDRAAPATLTPEPTGGVVWHASRGAITLRVVVSGREAHVGQAHLGVNGVRANDSHRPSAHRARARIAGRRMIGSPGTRCSGRCCPRPARNSTDSKSPHAR
ncbi:MAG: hypothetical protein ACR2OB_14035 [Solirubrobacteraceae bacterium]